MHIKGMSNFWTFCYNRSQKFFLPWFYSRRSGCQTSRESLKKMALQCVTALIISILVIPVKTPPWLKFSLHLFELRLLTKKKLYNVRKENLRLFEKLLYHVYGHQSFSSKTYFFAVGFCCCYFFFINDSTNVTFCSNYFPSLYHTNDLYVSVITYNCSLTCTFRLCPHESEHFWNRVFFIRICLDSSLYTSARSGGKAWNRARQHRWRHIPNRRARLESRLG